MTAPISKRILILDDDNEMRTMLEFLLAGEGHRVTLANNEAEAVSLHRQSPFDVAIIELFARSYNGFAAFDGLRHAASPPKFIVTAESIRVPVEAYLKIASQLGARETLAKPFTADQLLSAVRNVAAR